MTIIKHRAWFLVLPALLVALSLVAVFAYGLPIGLDFKGGALLSVSYPDGRPSALSVEERLSALPLGEIRVQPAGEDGFFIRTRDLAPAEKDAILSGLSEGGSTQVVEERFTSIGPALGTELARKALVAIVLVVLAIILYVAFVFRHVSKPVSSWTYGAITIATLAHDIIIPTGVFALLGVYTGAEVDALFVVALLTILGVSINDTIVVFDRIRENLRKNEEVHAKEPFEEVVGRSLSQTIARSINTSLTVIFVLIGLYFLGPEATRNFSLTLVVGMIAGTYSSIVLASPLLVMWERFRNKA